MSTIQRAERLYFAAVGVLAVWVGAWGLFRPLAVDSALPWLVPPLHARFLGAMYLSGTVFMIGCLVARWWTEVRIVVPMIAIWTGTLFLVSLMHASAFPWDRTQTWLWFGAYLVFPLVALGLTWTHRAVVSRTDGPLLAAWPRRYLGLQAVAGTGLAAALLVAPGIMVEAWPWKITPLLAQLYGAPFLTYGVGSLLLAREAR